MPILMNYNVFVLQLDNDEVDEGILEDNEDEPDFYTTAHMPW